VTFDPFGDFERQGYLRNFAKEKDLDIVRRLEHTSFTTGIDAAFERLATVKTLSYPDVLETHRILFGAVYPRAGQDRLTTAPNLAVSRPFIRETVPADRLGAQIAKAPGLDGNDEQNTVLGTVNDPALKARYEQQEMKRKRT
jgi:fido (protein-threonine AMPylation protein)